MGDTALSMRHMAAAHWGPRGCEHKHPWDMGSCVWPWWVSAAHANPESQASPGHGLGWHPELRCLQHLCWDACCKHVCGTQTHPVVTFVQRVPPVTQGPLTRCPRTPRVRAVQAVGRGRVVMFWRRWRGGGAGVRGWGPPRGDTRAVHGGVTPWRWRSAGTALMCCDITSAPNRRLGEQLLQPHAPLPALPTQAQIPLPQWGHAQAPNLTVQGVRCGPPKSSLHLPCHPAPRGAPACCGKCGAGL